MQIKIDTDLQISRSPDLQISRSPDLQIIEIEPGFEDIQAVEQISIQPESIVIFYS